MKNQTHLLTLNSKVETGEKMTAYLKCLQQYYLLWNQVNEALKLNYGDEQTDKIMEEVYYPISTKLNEMICSYISILINESFDYDCNITKIG